MLSYLIIQNSRILYSNVLMLVLDSHGNQICSPYPITAPRPEGTALAQSSCQVLGKNQARGAIGHPGNHATGLLSLLPALGKLGLQAGGGGKPVI